MNDSMQALWLDSFQSHVATTKANSGTDPRGWAKAGRATKDKPDGENLDWWEVEGLRQLEAYASWLDTTDWVFVDFDGIPGIEFPIDVAFGSQRVRGFIDAIMVTPEGQMVVIDHKTGSRTPDSLLQVGLYAAALEVMGYPRPALGCFWMTRKGIHTDPESLERYTPKFWEDMFSMFHRGLQADVFIPNVGSHCNTCSVRDACAAVGGVDAWKFDRMHPAYTDLQMQDTNKEEK